MKKALICGISGQDGSYMADLLLEKGYKVYGTIRRSSAPNYWRINHILDKVELVHCDVTDAVNVNSVISELKPDECYNFASMSQVGISFKEPVHAVESVGMNCLYFLEAIRHNSPKTKYLYAGSSVDGDTPIIIRLNGQIKTIKIKELCLEGGRVEYDNSNLECLSVRDDYSIGWNKIKYAFSHKSNDIYEIKGSNGLRLKLTGCHSVMVIDKFGKITSKPTSELSTNDFLISFNGKNNNTEWPILNWKDYESIYHNRNMKYKFDGKLVIDDDLMRLCGFYVSEGSLYEGKVTFTFHIKEDYYTRDIENIMLKYGIQVKHKEIPEANTRKVEFSSVEFANFIFANFGSHSKRKFLPSWIYTLPYSGFINFMNGYKGDAKIDEFGIRYTSVNKKLIEDILYLSKINGIDGKIIKRTNKAHFSPQKTIIKESTCYDLCFDGLFANMIDGGGRSTLFYKFNANLIPSEVVNFLSDKRIAIKKCFPKNKLKECNNPQLRMLANSQLHIIRIRDIKKLEEEIFVYDLHVPCTQNFLGGNYPIFLHNSEQFGSEVGENGFQDISTRMKVCSPYAAAKVLAFNMVDIYRKSYGLNARSNICFNHESPRRGEDFVTRKITKYLGKLIKWIKDNTAKPFELTQLPIYPDWSECPKLSLGNINSYRDWTHARDCVEAFYLTMQADPKDYIISSMKTYSVKEFLDNAFIEAQKYCDSDFLSIKNSLIKIDQNLYRPNEVEYLKGDSTPIRMELGWTPKFSFIDIVKDMVDSDIKNG